MALWNIAANSSANTILPVLNPVVISGTGTNSGHGGDGLRAWNQTATGTTYFLYDGTDPVCELDASGNVLALNTFGGAGLVSRTTSSGSVFYAFDERGNVAHRVNAGGTLLSSDVYDAYGKQYGGASDVYGFGAQAGYYTDSQTGLLLLTHRFYDPGTGRFLSRDPISYNGGINLYGYGGNNPGNETDAEGLDPKPIKPPHYWQPGTPYYPGVPEHPAGVDILDNIAMAQRQEGLLGLGTVK